MTNNHYCFHNAVALFVKNVHKQFNVNIKSVLRANIGDSYCKKCNIPQTIDDFSTLKRNQKIYAFVQLMSPKQNNIEQKQEPSPVQVISQAKPPLLYSFQQQSDRKASFNNQQNQNNQQTTPEQEELVTQAQNLKSGFQFFLKGNPGTTSNQRIYSAKRSDVNVSHTNIGEGSTEKGNTSIINEEKSQAPTKNNNHIADSAYSSSVRSITSQNFHPQKSLTKITQPVDNNQSKKQFCKIHFDKPIEYFCQQCYQSVCSKCMFHHHNGHELSQIDDALKVLLSKLQNFDSKVKEVVNEHSELNNQLIEHKSEIEQMKQKQQVIIDQKFAILQQKLDERKQSLSKEIMHKYDSQVFKANDKIRSCKNQQDELDQITSYNEKLIEKLQKDNMISQDGTQEQIDLLSQIPEYDKFIYENTLKLKSFQLSQKNTKLEIQGGDILGLRPVELSVQKAIDLIQTLVFDNTVERKVSNYILTNVNINHPKPETIIKNNQSDDSLSQHKLNSSFNFPIRGKSLANTPTNGQSLQQNVNNGMRTRLETQSPGIPLPQNMKSQPQSIISAGVPGIKPPSSKMTDQSSDSVSQANSKFARLKGFNRQATSQSQEFCLQLDMPQHNNQQETDQSLNPSTNLRPRPQTQEEIKNDEDDIEEINSQKIKLLDTAIYCIGDSRNILMYDYKSQQWNQLWFNKQESDYQGTLKFMSICQINLKKREFMMTGGCNNITKDPSSQCFRFTIHNIRAFREVQKMKSPRYGHASLYINQLVLVMGGFNHRDDEAEAPNSLNTCEKYSIKENEWTPIAPMQHERAYFSACRVKDEFVYVFGGLQNYETTNSIEFYNTMLDKWTLLSIQMPLRLAKYGLAKMDDGTIVIAGGLLAESNSTGREASSYQCVNTVYKFDCNTLKWSKLAKLNFRRALYQTMAVKENGQVFAIGGTVEGINEVYDIRKKKWNTCQSYTGVAGQNDLQTYAICSLSKNIEE